LSQTPYIAVVLEGGLVQTVILEAWPPAVPLPRILVVDYDTEGADDDELTTFTIGADHYEAVCHGVEPTVYESLDTALSPKALLTCDGDQPGQIEDVVEHVRRMAEKYDFTPDADSVLGTVRESAEILRITLSDQEVAEGIRRLLDTGDTRST
jgi:hypothetical protein